MINNNNTNEDDDILIELDDERHRREEAERRAKRHRTREERERNQEGDVREKERKRKEHAARILGAQQKTTRHQHHHQVQQRSSSKDGKGQPPPPPSSSSSSRRGGKKPTSSPSTTAGSSGGGGGTSIFKSIFNERAEGFFVDLRFRNAPPRPPVGPIFVGSGLDGELLSKWTQYGENNNSRSTSNNNNNSSNRNTVERRYEYKLHPGDHMRSLVRILAYSAMDVEGCYRGERTGGGGGGGGGRGDGVVVGGAGGVAQSSSSGGGATMTSSSSAAVVIETLPPEDEALIEWKGGMGDSSAMEAQKARMRGGAAGRASSAHMSGGGGGAGGIMVGGGGVGGGGKSFRLKGKSHLQSRILDERTPNFMKRTTYLTNDSQSVHRFTSLATTQVRRARDVDIAVAESRNRYAGSDVIEMGFVEANGKYDVLPFVVVSSSVSSGGEEEDEKGGEKNDNGNGRTHPSKKDVYPVWDLPLLPDVRTWGHTITHVVIDNPPRNVVSDDVGASRGERSSSSSGGEQRGDDLPGVGRLDDAIVADVSRQAHNARMECTVWVPTKKKTTSTSTPTSSSSEKKSRKSSGVGGGGGGRRHVAVQKYDLDVVPLRDPSAPPVHYVWTIDPSSPGSRNGGGQNYVGYHPIGSRVQLSMGRPAVDVAQNANYVTRRELDEGERRAWEIRTAEVDVDLAEKHGLVVVEGDASDDGGEGGGMDPRGNSRPGGGGGRRKPIGREESEGDDGGEDAF